MSRTDLPMPTSAEQRIIDEIKRDPTVLHWKYTLDELPTRVRQSLTAIDTQRGLDRSSTRNRAVFGDTHRSPTLQTTRKQKLSHAIYTLARCPGVSPTRAKQFLTAANALATDVRVRVATHHGSRARRASFYELSRSNRAIINSIAQSYAHNDDLVAASYAAYGMRVQAERIRFNPLSIG